ncbi:MAG: hypothetical protein AAGA57_11895 [Planctomycetota bacterium]
MRSLAAGILVCSTSLASPAFATQVIDLTDLIDLPGVIRIDLDALPTEFLPADPPLPGDTNFDGVVDLLDFDHLTLWFGQDDPNHYRGPDGRFLPIANTAWYPFFADFNKDLVVDMLDFEILAINFGQTESRPLPPELFPEPDIASIDSPLFAFYDQAAGAIPVIAALPEPTTGLLLTIPAAGALARRRRT